LCLNFEDRSTFPHRRAELYEDAIDALLKKWDASRDITRDEIYRPLSLGRKRQLFAQIAAEYFETGEIFFDRSDLSTRVIVFLRKLPRIGSSEEEPEGEAIIKGIEAQHGIFIERAQRVYSFSHLTLQEYFTARYIVDNATEGTLQRLIEAHLTDVRWHEIFLLTASLLPKADTFISDMRRAIDQIVGADASLVAFGQRAAEKAERDYHEVGQPAIMRAIARVMTGFSPVGINLSLLPTRDLDRDLDLVRILHRELAPDLDLHLGLALADALHFDLRLDLDNTHILGVDLDRDLYFDLALLLILGFADRAESEYQRFINKWIEGISADGEELGLTELTDELARLPVLQEQADEDAWRKWEAQLQDITIRYRNIGYDWNFTDEQRERLDQYEKATVLLAECVQLAAVSNRDEIINSLLLPPAPKNESTPM
jgi:hypothetical protein